MKKSNTNTWKDLRLSQTDETRLLEKAGVAGHRDLLSLRRYTHLHHADIVKKLGARERHNAKDSD